MANEYVGVNNVARRISKKYAGVNNVARTIKAEYAGVNGVSRKIFEGKPYIRAVFESWNYTSSDSTYTISPDRKRLTFDVKGTRSTNGYLFFRLKRSNGQQFPPNVQLTRTIQLTINGSGGGSTFWRDEGGGTNLDLGPNVPFRTIFSTATRTDTGTSTYGYALNSIMLNVDSYNTARITGTLSDVIINGEQVFFYDN